MHVIYLSFNFLLFLLVIVANIIQVYSYKFLTLLVE